MFQDQFFFQLLYAFSNLTFFSSDRITRQRDIIIIDIYKNFEIANNLFENFDQNVFIPYTLKLVTIIACFYFLSFYIVVLIS